MVKYYLDEYSKQLIVGLKGTRDEINEAFTSLWNHGATNGELEWIKDNFARFFSTKQKFERAVMKGILFKLFNENPSFRGKKEMAHKLFNQKMAAVRWRDLKVFNETESNFYYRVHESTDCIFT